MFIILDLLTNKTIGKVELKGKIKTKVNKKQVTNMGSLKYINDFAVNLIGLNEISLYVNI